MKRSADATFDIAESSSSSITLPSPQAQSPASSSCSDSQPAGPSRKRARGDITPEERKEARAHRNRIAAQNSRDRRKAQFVFLERRVAELEEENRQLKAGMGLTELRNTTSDNITNEQREREKAKEKENEELRERIKTLENGWDAVVKALAASGLPLQIPSPSAPNSLQSESSSTPSHPSISFPAMVQPSPVFPLTPASSTPTSSPNSEVELDDFETTCHLARVVSTDAPLLSSVPRQRVVSQRISSNSSSSPLPPLIPSRHQQHRQQLTISKARQPLLQPTRLSWKTCSARSLRQVPASRRQLCLLLLPQAKSLPRRSSRPPPWPQRRRR
ncbi:unnamed protein product [Somion occarium]|uniref:X-box-binding protein 1 n=1 Tax=Somion occarium TaxID=3059160 RepID=A0ABP1DEW5_9APHY